MNPFDFVKDISNRKEYLIKDNESNYNSFVVNRAFSYFIDTVLYANEINKTSELDNKLKHDFLFFSIRKRNRFSKWLKPETDPDFKTVQNYYKYSDAKTKETLSILSREQISILTSKQNKGEYD